MLSGDKPFDGNDIREVLLAIQDGTYEYNEEKWYHISSEARDFVTRLICTDVKRRMSAAEALQHPWIVNGGRRESIADDLSRLGSNRRIHQRTFSDDEEMY